MMTTATPSGEQLRNSRPLDVHRWSDRPEAKEAVDSIFPELFPNIRRKDSVRSRRDHLRVVILDLWHSYLQDPEQYVGISLNRNSFGTAKRYDELHIDYAPFVDVVRALKHYGYITLFKGFRNRNIGKGFQSRIRATETLITILKQAPKLAAAAMEMSANAETIILRDEDKQTIDYEDTDQTRAMRDLLARYNQVLARTYIDIHLKGYPEPVKIDLSNKWVKRVFNNRSFDQGGRFYGGWWQGLSKNLRQRILIRGKPTREIDYRGLHIVVLYALRGIDYFQDVDNDPYKLDGYDYSEDEGEKYRDLFKLILLCALNAKDKISALRAVQSDLNQDDEGKYPAGVKLAEALDAFIKKHARISKDFFRQNALQLQRLDSDVAEGVIREMTAKEYPVLCIHDSFICVRTDTDFLANLLRDQLNEVLVQRGGKPIAARLKMLQDFFARPDDKKWVTDDISELEKTIDLDQQKRLGVWGTERVQYPINYVPDGTAGEPSKRVGEGPPSPGSKKSDKPSQPRDKPDDYWLDM